MLLPSTTALITTALNEDIGSGDITSKAFISAGTKSHARIITRKPAVAAGLKIAAEVFCQVDPEVQITFAVSEGDFLKAGATLLEVTGSTRSLLSAERVALNFLGRLIGIATLTRAHVDAVAGSGVTILDTRKMTPGWRQLEKEAVKLGGGKNHRIGLFDAILVKDNHLAALGKEWRSVLPNIIKELRLDHPKMKIEFEADRLQQLEFFLGLKEIDVVLLDNMSLEEMRAAVLMRDQLAPTLRLEASGGITLENICAVAETGIDEISLGALTHSALWADLSLDLFENSTDAAKHFVAPVLEASSTLSRLTFCAPSTPCASSASANFERVL